DGLFADSRRQTMTPEPHLTGLSASPTLEGLRGGAITPKRAAVHPSRIGSNVGITLVARRLRYKGSDRERRITPTSLRRTGRAPLDATQLYGPTTRRMVNPVPLFRLVRSALPGVAVHRSRVSLSPLSRWNDTEHHEQR